MNFDYSPRSGLIRNETYRQFGHLDGSENGTGSAVTIDFQFRLATNGVIVNTLANDEPLITTSAGYFNK